MEAEVKALFQEFRGYVDKLQREWISQNRIRSNEVYEVMRPEQQAEVHARINQWKRYITPIAEEWWRERGYRVHWPDNDSKPMKVFKLETSLGG